MSTDAIPVPQGPEFTVPISRRGILGAAFGLFAIAAAPGLLSQPAQAATAEDPPLNDVPSFSLINDGVLAARTNDESSVTITDGSRNPEPEQGKGSYGDTLKKTFMLEAANAGISLGAKAVGITTGNALLTINREVDDHERLEIKKDVANLSRSRVLKILGQALVVNPFREEVTFRFIPSQILHWLGAKGNAWSVGLASSILFADTHAREMERGAKAIPVQQCNFGLLSWWLQQNRGFRHALLAHSASNAVPATLLAGGYEVLRKKHRA